MLHALGFPDDQMPKLLVHGWWNISGAKMSKSLGNVVDPDVLADKYGVEALRYYLMSDIYSGRDADFVEERLVQRWNTDLANNLGNLLNRTISMLWKYRDGVLTKTGDSAGRFFDIDDVIAKSDVCSILGVVMVQGQTANGLIEYRAPWKIAKQERDGDAGAKRELDYVLYDLAERLRAVAISVSPVLPKAAHGIFDQLNWKMEPELAGKEARFSLGDAEWGKLPDGHVVGKPTPLFPRIEGNSG
jgi:methionyl-tRNA synthetase